MLLRLRAEHYYIDLNEYGELLMQIDDPDVVLKIETLDDMKKVLELIDEHGLCARSFRYLKYMKGFRIDVRKKESYDDKVVTEDDKESLIAVAVLSTANNVVDMFNIVRGGRNKVIEVVAKYFKEILPHQEKESVRWETEIPLETFDENNYFDGIKPAERISADESDYYVKVRKIEEGTFIPFTSATPDWVPFNWTGEDMKLFHQLLMPELDTFDEK